MKYLVMMPTYNEIEVLEHTVTGLLDRLPGANVLIIDDNSPDGTSELAGRLAAADKRIFVLHRPAKAGLGAAYGAGVAWGLERGYEYLIQMDADGSHRAEDLTRMLDAASPNVLVIGSRWVRGGEVANWSKLRELISRFGNFYTRLLLGGAVRDMTAGFRIYPAELARRLPFGKSVARGYGFQVEMTMRALDAGHKVVEVPITFVEREGGHSKMTMGIIIEAFLLTTRWGLARLFKR